MTAPNGEHGAAPRRRRKPGSGTDRQARPGQSLVELALVSLLLATIGVGAVEVGRAYHAALTMAHAARDGARVAADEEMSDADVIDAVEASAAPLTVVSPPGIARAGDEVTVTASYSFTTPVPLVAELWGGGALIITRTATARIG